MVLGFEELEPVSMVLFSVEFVRTVPAYMRSESSLWAGGPKPLGVGRDTFSKKLPAPRLLKLTKNFILGQNGYTKNEPLFWILGFNVQPTSL